LGRSAFVNAPGTQMTVCFSAGLQLRDTPTSTPSVSRPARIRFNRPRSACHGYRCGPPALYYGRIPYIRRLRDGLSTISPDSGGWHASSDGMGSRSARCRRVPGPADATHFNRLSDSTATRVHERPLCPSACSART
jgi:hypothetical protein